MRVSQVFVSVLASASVAVAAACGGSSTPAPSADALVISVGIGEPKRLIPSTATETFGAQVMDALFTSLVEYDASFRPVEVAAESITSTDNKVWTITLKPGWTFHNGEPVTADSYINAWNAGAWGPNAHDGNYFFDKLEGYAELNPRDGKSAPKAKKLTGLIKKDDLTFNVVLSEPYANFKAMLGYTAFLPVPQVAFADLANNVFDPTYEASPIGQGPFKMKGVWQHDQLIEVERYDGFKGAAPKIAGIQFKIYQQLTTEYQDLLSGQLDIVPRLPLESLGNARADLGDRYGQSPLSAITLLGFPTFDPRYSRVEVRKAISMAIDREEVLKAIFYNSQTPLRSFVSNVVPGHRPDTCGEPCQYNPAKAKALFDSVSGAKLVGGRIELAYNVDGGHKPWIDAVCNQLRKNLAVECVGNPQPKFSELLTKLKKKERVGAFRFGWVFDYPAMENYLGPLYTTYGSSNYYGYSNRLFDDLVAKGDKAASVEAATAFYQQAEDLLARDFPVIPLFQDQNNFGYSTRVRNVELDLFRRPVLAKLEANPTR
jgi:oligopeptide transport system substrate-binding protein